MADMGSTNEDRLGLLSDALPEAIGIFRKLDEEGRARLFKTLSTLFDIKNGNGAEPNRGPVTVSYGEPTGFPKNKAFPRRSFSRRSNHGPTWNASPAWDTT